MISKNEHVAKKKFFLFFENCFLFRKDSELPMAKIVLKNLAKV